MKYSVSGQFLIKHFIFWLSRVVAVGEQCNNIIQFCKPLNQSLLDKSKFHEFKANYGTGLVAGYGRIGGHLVALVANNGNLNVDAAKKVMSVFII